MESIGRILFTAREKSGMSLDTVARETNISRSYIVALEADDYSAFPGEPYLVGFLRTYCEYLDLNSEELMGAYRHLKIQEQPAPMEALLNQNKPLPIRLLALGGAALLIIILLIWRSQDVGGWFGGLGSWVTSNVQNTRVPEVVVLEEDQNELERRFFLEDTIEVRGDGLISKFTVKSIDDSLVITGGSGETHLRLGQESFLDLDGNSTTDLRFALLDIDESDEKKGVSLIVQKLATVNIIPVANEVVLGEEALVALTAPASIRPERQRQSQVIQDAPATAPFQVEVVFRGNSLFRYQADDKPREEGFWDKGESVRIDASKQVVLAGSNAGAFVVRVGGKELEMGEAGQVSARLLRWVRSGNAFQLRLDPLY